MAAGAGSLGGSRRGSRSVTVSPAKAHRVKAAAVRLSFADLLDAAPLLTLGTLPPEATFASVHYCIEAGEMPSRRASLSVFKSVPATWIEVPVADIAVAMMLIPEIVEDFPTFEAYCAWYLSAGPVPRYTEKDRWPCIATCMADEIIQDGSHRMHSYIRAGHPTIPILRYDARSWWTAQRVWHEETFGPGPGPDSDGGGDGDQVRARQRA